MDFNKLNIFFRCGKEYGRNAIKDLGINDTEYTICSFLYFYKDAPQDLICKSYMIDKTTGDVVEDTESIHSWEYVASSGSSGDDSDSSSGDSSYDSSYDSEYDDGSYDSSYDSGYDDSSYDSSYDSGYDDGSYDNE